jgi:glyoxylase-like metal-dependent hydrolase (beta-lactamase superfamily II)
MLKAAGERNPTRAQRQTDATSIDPSPQSVEPCPRRPFQLSGLSTETLRVLEPYPGLFAYYDGRVSGKRLYSEHPNWVDDGAYSLGIASYSIVRGSEALVYDTHISLSHARFMRSHLEARGVTSIRVVLSHWHDDHIAGNGVFADCEIIALRLTAEALATHRKEIETGTPPISPLVMPNRLFDGQLDLVIGPTRIELHHFNIHSTDGNVLWLPDSKVLLAGDTLEDTITYIAEPAHIATHIRELQRLRTWPIEHILPNHGDERKIAAGGYGPSLIHANKAYLERLTAARNRSHVSLKEFVAPEIAANSIIYFEPYEEIHRRNIDVLDS